MSPALKHLILKMTFKLYDKLKFEVDMNSANNYELTNELRATINRLPNEHREIFYVLILHHAQLNNDIALIPYKARVGNGDKGITFDATNLPVDLVKILVQYLYNITET